MNIFFVIKFYEHPNSEFHLHSFYSRPELRTGCRQVFLALFAWLSRQFIAGCNLVHSYWNGWKEDGIFGAVEKDRAIVSWESLFAFCFWCILNPLTNENKILYDNLIKRLDWWSEIRKKPMRFLYRETRTDTSADCIIWWALYDNASGQLPLLFMIYYAPCI